MPKLRFTFLLALCLVAGCGKGKTDPAPAENKPTGEPVTTGLEPTGWKRFAPEGAGYAVYFPSDPVLGTVTAPDRIIDQASTKRASRDTIGYSCYWFVREKPMQAGAANAYIMGQQKGAVQTAKGKLNKETALTVNGNPGREFEMTVNPDTTMRYRIIVAGRLHCTLLAVGKDPASVRGEEADEFFKSFDLTGAR